MNKRKDEVNKENETSSKKMNYDAWKKPCETGLTTPQRPTTNGKYDFNIWNSTETPVKGPMKITELGLGICLHRPIHMRVSLKSAKKSTKNGEMFHFIATDGNVEIQITVFPQQLNSFDLIKFNGTYELINFNVKAESKDFPLFVGNGRFISLLSSSKITPIENDSVPELQFNFNKIDEVLELEVNSKCDIVAVIAMNWGNESVGQNKTKRDISITDESKQTIIVTLWGASFEQFEHVNIPIIIHNGVVAEFNGIKTINCAPNTLFWHNPDIAIARDLKDWFDKEMVELKLSN